MKKKVLLVSLALCLFLFGSTGLSLAQDREAPERDPLEKMMAEGWRPVAEGVLQRSRGENKVETFTFGPEGMQWALQDMEKRHAELVERYAAHPSPELRKAIRGLKGSIENTREALANPSSESLDKVLINGCDVRYGAHADAYPLSPGPGVGATADAYIDNTCGYTGEVYAYAYGEATSGTVVTRKSQTDGPKYGSVTSSYASVSVSGRPYCYSSAYSYIKIAALSITLSATDNNYSCPDPPLVVSITPPTSPSVLGYNCKTLTWSASVSGGMPPYSYAWYRDGVYVGSGSSYSATFCGDNTNRSENVSLTLVVTDSVGNTGSASKQTTVNYFEKPDICCREPINP